MKTPGFEIIQALRNTARSLQNSKDYQWGHMGSCNCGFLAQEVTRLSKKEIHQRAMNKQGDWSEQLNDYCPSSGLLMDEMISTILDFGFSAEDLKHLERLSNPEILQQLPPHTHLQHNIKEDVILYINIWANLLEDQLEIKLDTQPFEMKKDEVLMY